MTSPSGPTVPVPASPGEAVSQKGFPKGDAILVTTIAFLWLQLYWSAKAVWLNGDYYDYAWLVPPAAAFFFHRRFPGIQDFAKRSALAEPKRGGAGLVVAAAILLPLIFGIRAIEGFDPTWRPPIILHAGVATLVSHWLLWRWYGRKASLSLIPVTIFALSAIPYPYTLEKIVIQGLTEWVVQTSGGLFELVGRPVIVSGGILEFKGTQVEVTEGCSGIQSLQSLIMVALFFGEFSKLQVSRRLLLVISAGFLALTVNVARALLLARIRFDQGEASFEASHDLVGFGAFAIGGLSLFLMMQALLAMDGRKGKKVRHTLKKNNDSHDLKSLS